MPAANVESLMVETEERNEYMTRFRLRELVEGWVERVCAERPADPFQLLIDEAIEQRDSGGGLVTCENPWCRMTMPAAQHATHLLSCNQEENWVRCIRCSERVEVGRIFQHRLHCRIDRCPYCGEMVLPRMLPLCPYRLIQEAERSLQASRFLHERQQRHQSWTQPSTPNTPHSPDHLPHPQARAGAVNRKRQGSASTASIRLGSQNSHNSGDGEGSRSQYIKQNFTLEAGDDSVGGVNATSDRVRTSAGEAEGRRPLSQPQSREGRRRSWKKDGREPAAAVRPSPSSPTFSSTNTLLAQKRASAPSVTSKPHDEDAADKPQGEASRQSQSPRSAKAAAADRPHRVYAKPTRGEDGKPYKSSPAVTEALASYPASLLPRVTLVQRLWRSHLFMQRNRETVFSRVWDSMDAAMESKGVTGLGGGTALKGSTGLTVMNAAMEAERFFGKVAAAGEDGAAQTPAADENSLARPPKALSCGAADELDDGVVVSEEPDSRTGAFMSHAALEKLMAACASRRVLRLGTVVRIIRAATTILRTTRQAVVQRVSIPPHGDVAIFGDLHGQMKDFLHALRVMGHHPSERRYFLFNGDFIDRGPYGCEVIIGIFALLCAYPQYVLLNRGNHEDYRTNTEYGFMAELFAKYGDQANQIHELLVESYEAMPLMTILDKRAVVVHGGVPREPCSLDEIEAVGHVRDIPVVEQQTRREKILADILWNDPVEKFRSRQIGARHQGKGWRSSKRGCGAEYLGIVTDSFLKMNKLQFVIRSHDVMPSGFNIIHSGRSITVFSASNYGGVSGNRGAVALLSKQSPRPIFHTWFLKEDMEKELQRDDASGDAAPAQGPVTGTDSSAAPKAPACRPRAGCSGGAGGGPGKTVFSDPLVGNDEFIQAFYGGWVFAQPRDSDDAEATAVKESAHSKSADTTTTAAVATALCREGGGAGKAHAPAPAAASAPAADEDARLLQEDTDLPPSTSGSIDCADGASAEVIDGNSADAVERVKYAYGIAVSDTRSADDVTILLQLRTVQEIRELIFLNRYTLLTAFNAADEEHTGVVYKVEWCVIMQQALDLDLPWYYLCQFFTPRIEVDGIPCVEYVRFLYHFDALFAPAYRPSWQRQMIQRIFEPLDIPEDIVRAFCVDEVSAADAAEPLAAATMSAGDSHEFPLPYPMNDTAPNTATATSQGGSSTGDERAAAAEWGEQSVSVSFTASEGDQHHCHQRARPAGNAYDGGSSFAGSLNGKGLGAGSTTRHLQERPSVTGTGSSSCASNLGRWRDTLVDFKTFATQIRSVSPTAAALEDYELYSLFRVMDTNCVGHVLLGVLTDRVLGMLGEHPESEQAPVEILSGDELDFSTVASTGGGPKGLRSMALSTGSSNAVQSSLSFTSSSSTSSSASSASDTTDAAASKGLHGGNPREGAAQARARGSPSRASHATLVDVADADDDPKPSLTRKTGSQRSNLLSQMLRARGRGGQGDDSVSTMTGTASLGHGRPLLRRQSSTSSASSGSGSRHGGDTIAMRDEVGLDGVVSSVNTAFRIPGLSTMQGSLEKGEPSMMSSTTPSVATTKAAADSRARPALPSPSLLPASDSGSSGEASSGQEGSSTERKVQNEGQEARGAGERFGQRTAGLKPDGVADVSDSSNSTSTAQWIRSAENSRHRLSGQSTLDHSQQQLLQRQQQRQQRPPSDPEDALEYENDLLRSPPLSEGDEASADVNTEEKATHRTPKGRERADPLVAENQSASRSCEDFVKAFRHPYPLSVVSKPRTGTRCVLGDRVRVPATPQLREDTAREAVEGTDSDNGEDDGSVHHTSASNGGSPTHAHCDAAEVAEVAPTGSPLLARRSLDGMGRARDSSDDEADGMRGKRASDAPPASQLARMGNELHATSKGPSESTSAAADSATGGGGGAVFTPPTGAKDLPWVYPAFIHLQALLLGGNSHSRLASIFRALNRRMDGRLSENEFGALVTYLNHHLERPLTPEQSSILFAVMRQDAFAYIKANRSLRSGSVATANSSHVVGGTGVFSTSSGSDAAATKQALETVAWEDERVAEEKRFGRPFIRMEEFIAFFTITTVSFEPDPATTTLATGDLPLAINLNSSSFMPVISMHSSAMNMRGGTPSVVATGWGAQGMSSIPNAGAVSFVRMGHSPSVSAHCSTGSAQVLVPGAGYIPVAVPQAVDSTATAAAALRTAQPRAGPRVSVPQMHSTSSPPHSFTTTASSSLQAQALQGRQNPVPAATPSSSVYRLLVALQAKLGPKGTLSDALALLSAPTASSSPASSPAPSAAAAAATAAVAHHGAVNSLADHSSQITSFHGSLPATSIDANGNLGPPVLPNCQAKVGAGREAERLSDQGSILHASGPTSSAATAGSRNAQAAPPHHPHHHQQPAATVAILKAPDNAQLAEFPTLLAAAHATTPQPTFEQPLPDPAAADRIGSSRRDETAVLGTTAARSGRGPRGEEGDEEGDRVNLLSFLVTPESSVLGNAPSAQPSSSSPAASRHANSSSNSTSVPFTGGDNTAVYAPSQPSQPRPPPPLSPHFSTQPVKARGREGDGIAPAGVRGMAQELSTLSSSPIGLNVAASTGQNLTSLPLASRPYLLNRPTERRITVAPAACFQSTPPAPGNGVALAVIPGRAAFLGFPPVLPLPSAVAPRQANGRLRVPTPTQPADPTPISPRLAAEDGAPRRRSGHPHPCDSGGGSADSEARLGAPKRSDSQPPLQWRSLHDHEPPAAELGQRKKLSSVPPSPPAPLRRSISGTSTASSHGRKGVSASASRTCESSSFAPSSPLTHLPKAETRERGRRDAAQTAVPSAARPPPHAVGGAEAPRKASGRPQEMRKSLCQSSPSGPAAAAAASPTGATGKHTRAISGATASIPTGSSSSTSQRCGSVGRAAAAAALEKIESFVHLSKNSPHITAAGGGAPNTAKAKCHTSPSSSTSSFCLSKSSSRFVPPPSSSAKLSTARVDAAAASVADTSDTPAICRAPSSLGRGSAACRARSTQPGQTATSGPTISTRVSSFPSKEAAGAQEDGSARAAPRPTLPSTELRPPPATSSPSAPASSPPPPPPHQQQQPRSRPKLSSPALAGVLQRPASANPRAAPVLRALPDASSSSGRLRSPPASTTSVSVAPTATMTTKARGEGSRRAEAAQPSATEATHAVSTTSSAEPHPPATLPHLPESQKSHADHRACTAEAAATQRVVAPAPLPASSVTSLPLAQAPLAGAPRSQRRLGKAVAAEERRHGTETSSSTRDGGGDGLTLSSHTDEKAPHALNPSSGTQDAAAVDGAVLNKEGGGRRSRSRLRGS